MNTQELIEKIDAVLPQTQCGLCSYKGCKPYAEAIANNNELINRCPPGGIETLLQLAEITQQSATPFLADMEVKAKPPMLAIIKEDECIGCTKCIQACPVDAIIGNAKQMHSILSSECTGCELCIAPCPTDCIKMVVLPSRNAAEKQQRQNLARKRFYARNARLQRLQTEKKLKHDAAKQLQATIKLDTIAARQNAIAAAVARAKAKKTRAS